MAISAFGATLRIGTTEVAEVRDMSGLGLSLDAKETTNHSSANGWYESVGTIFNGGKLQLNVNFLPGNATHTQVLDVMTSRQKANFVLIFPDSYGTTWSFCAYVTRFEPESVVNGRMSADIELESQGLAALPSDVPPGTPGRYLLFGVFAATSKGLYWSSPFYFDEREVAWTRLGQELDIRRFAVDPENPASLQLAVGSNKVLMRRPIENSDWQEILDYSTALATIGEDNLGQNHFAWVVYNPVLEMIHVSYNYKNTGYKYILSSPDCGTSWVASEYLPPPSFRYVIGNMVIHPSTGELYVSGCAYYTGSGLVMHSIDAVSFDVDVSFDGGGWAPYLFRDSEGAVYAGEATDSYPRLYRREDGGWTQVDGSLGAGVISGSPNLFDPNGAGAVNPEDVNVVRIIRDNKLYYTNDYWNTGDFRTISEFSLGRAIDCDKKTRLVIGRVDASENDSHVVFSTVNDGVEMRAKGGPHADQLDGGEDSIPYPAKIADNGIKIV
jgi:hypothetical protein